MPRLTDATTTDSYATTQQPPRVRTQQQHGQEAGLVSVCPLGAERLPAGLRALACSALLSPGPPPCRQASTIAARDASRPWRKKQSPVGKGIGDDGRKTTQNRKGTLAEAAIPLETSLGLLDLERQQGIRPQLPAASANVASMPRIRGRKCLMCSDPRRDALKSSRLTDAYQPLRARLQTNLQPTMHLCAINPGYHAFLIFCRGHACGYSHCDGSSSV